MPTWRRARGRLDNNENESDGKIDAIGNEKGGKEYQHQQPLLPRRPIYRRATTDGSPASIVTLSRNASSRIPLSVSGGAPKRRSDGDVTPNTSTQREKEYGGDGSIKLCATSPPARHLQKRFSRVKGGSWRGSLKNVKEDAVAEDNDLDVFENDHHVFRRHSQQPTKRRSLLQKQNHRRESYGSKSNSKSSDSSLTTKYGSKSNSNSSLSTGGSYSSISVDVMDFGYDPQRKDSMRSIANSSYTSRSSAVDSDGFMWQKRQSQTSQPSSADSEGFVAWQKKSSSEYSSLDTSDREKEKLERELHELQLMIVNTRRLLKGATLVTTVESLNKGIQEKKQRLKEINERSMDRTERTRGTGGQTISAPGLKKQMVESNPVNQAISEGENSNTKATKPSSGITRQVRRLSNIFAGSITSKMNSSKRRGSDESLPDRHNKAGGTGVALRQSAFSYFNTGLPVQRQKAKGKVGGPLRSSAFSFFRKSSIDETIDDPPEENDARPAIWVKKEGNDGVLDIREMRKELYG